MSNELSPNVDAYIKRVLPQAKKELKFVNEEDWSTIESVKKRENAYKIQLLLVDRNVKSAEKLYKMAGEDLGKKRVKTALGILVSFYTIFDDRYKVMIEKFDWTGFDLENDDEAKKAKAEVEFQAEALKDINSLVETLQKINFGNESDQLNMSFHGERKVPFAMKEMMERLYPEIGEFLEKQNKKK